MTYDHWKTTNPEDEWLGPDPMDEGDDPDNLEPEIDRLRAMLGRYAEAIKRATTIEELRKALE